MGFHGTKRAGKVYFRSMDGSQSPDADGRNPKIGPWTRLSSRDVYDNPWIHVREDQVIHPDGSPGIYGVIHYKHLAVAVIPIDAQGRLVMVGQHRYPLDYYSWELPEGGCLAAKETAEEAARRELREETGFTAARWDYLGEFVLSNSASDEVGHFYLARELTPGPMQPDATEDLRVRLVDFPEAHRQAMEGELTESLTVAGLARAMHFLEKEKRTGGQPPRRRE
jgi:ADP-ribose pyrophosphatase